MGLANEYGQYSKPSSPLVISQELIAHPNAPTDVPGAVAGAYLITQVTRPVTSVAAFLWLPCLAQTQGPSIANRLMDPKVSR